jgi:hypothetical protein
MNLHTIEIISIHHDGIEVCRNEQGKWVEVPTSPESPNKLPDCVQFFFDRRLVYQLKSGVVEKNELQDWIETENITPLSGIHHGSET